MSLLCFICFLSLFSCNETETHKYKETAKCCNLTIHLSYIYSKESVFLYFNEELIYRTQIDSLEGNRFEKGFCLNFGKNDSLHIVTEYKGKRYIDEIFVIEYPATYVLTTSTAYPLNWKEMFEITDVKELEDKGWGYPPIDSSVRFINFSLKSEFTELMDSIPMRNFRESGP